MNHILNEFDEKKVKLLFRMKKSDLENIQQRKIYKKAFREHQQAIKNYLLTHFKSKFILNYTLYNNLGDNTIHNDKFDLISDINDINILYPFKISASLGYFYHNKENIIRYFHSSDNNFTLPFHHLIRNEKQLKTYIQKLKNYDVSHMFDKYGIHNILLTNITFYLYRLVGGKNFNKSSNKKTRYDGEKNSNKRSRYVSKKNINKSSNKRNEYLVNEKNINKRNRYVGEKNINKSSNKRSEYLVNGKNINKRNLYLVGGKNKSINKRSQYLIGTKSLIHKKNAYNPKNKNSLCLIYCLAYFFKNIMKYQFPIKDIRNSLFNLLQDLYTNDGYKLNDIPKIEKILNIPIQIFYIQNKKIECIYRNNIITYKKPCKLLFIMNNFSLGHFILLKNISTPYELKISKKTNLHNNIKKQIREFNKTKLNEILSIIYFISQFLKNKIVSSGFVSSEIELFNIIYKKFQNNILCYKTILLIEKFLGIRINLYKIHLNKLILYKESINNNSFITINLLKINNHLYIPILLNKINMEKTFICDTCQYIFTSKNNLIRHTHRCALRKSKKIIFKKGVFHPTTPIWKEINLLLNENICQITPYFATYDFESYKDQNNFHIPISFSISTNLPGFSNTFHIMNDKPNKLIQYFIIILKLLSQYHYSRYYEKNVKNIQEKLKIFFQSYIKTHMNFINNINEKYELIRYCMNNLENLSSKYIIYCKQFIIISFNGKRYDLNLIKKYLFPLLLPIQSVIKRNTAYNLISTKDFRFIDITNYLAANTSYTKFLNSFNVPIHKTFFPYDWFNNPKQLNETLPNKDVFYNSLTDTHLTNEQYYSVQLLWETHNMTSMKDLLKIYNNLDTEGLLLGCLKVQNMFLDKNYFLFKDYISLAQLSLDYAFKICDFPCIEHIIDYELHDQIRKSIVGGPSILFNRKVIKGESKIKEHIYKNNALKVGNIIAYDINGLYLSTLLQRIGEGPYHFYKLNSNNNLYLTHPTKITFEYKVIYLFSKELNINIQHSYYKNQYRVGYKNIPVDGFFTLNNKKYIISALGCFYHKCNICNYCKTEEDKIIYNKTLQILSYLRQHNYIVIEFWEHSFNQFLKQKMLNAPHMTRERYLKENIPYIFLQPKRQFSQNEAINLLKSGRMFGLINVSMNISNKYKHFFDDFPIFFKNINIKFHDIDNIYLKNLLIEENHPVTKINGVKQLISSHSIENSYLSSDLIKFYLNFNNKFNDNVINIKIHNLLLFQGDRNFENIVNEICEMRYQTYNNPTLEPLSKLIKAIGNNIYGSSIMNLTNHKNILICNKKKKKKIN